jgi:hypothetical protein
MTKNPNVEFAVACHSLRKLMMMIDYHTFSSYDWKTGLHTPLSLDEVLDALVLRPLLGCENLLHIQFDGTEGNSFHGVTSKDLETLNAVGRC